MSTLHLCSTCTAIQQTTAQTRSTAAGEGDVRVGEKLCPPSGAGNPPKRPVRVSSESSCRQKPLLFFFLLLFMQWVKPWPCLNQTKYFYCIIKIPCFNTSPCTNEVKQCRVQNCQIYKMIKQISKASRDHAQRYQKFDIDSNFIV